MALMIPPGGRTPRYLPRPRYTGVEKQRALAAAQGRLTRALQEAEASLIGLAVALGECLVINSAEVMEVLEYRKVKTVAGTEEVAPDLWRDWLDRAKRRSL